MRTVLYFGYGANRHADMISAITGKSPYELKGVPAVLIGYELAVQRLDQVPEGIAPGAPVKVSPRAILEAAWPPGFTSYVIRSNEDGQVRGTIWELTVDERERVRDWELVDFGWYEDFEGMAMTDNGEEVSVLGERINHRQPIDHIVNGLEYETWLNDPEVFRVKAAQTREEYDKRISGSKELSRREKISLNQSRPK
jgi:hypothetical protein